MPDPSSASVPGRLAAAWSRHGGTVRVLALAYLAVAAAGKLHYALPHLLHEVEPWSGLDVRYRFQEVTAWFAGRPVYGAVDSAVYPPATYAILRPLVGWGSVEAARMLWAITILAAAAALFLAIHRLAAPARARDRLLVSGLVLAAYPFPASVMIGQLGIHVAALVAWGAVLLFRRHPRWWSDALAAVLLACSLVKPTVAVPLVTVALIRSRRAGPAALTAAVYAALTLTAAEAQPAGLATLLQDWLGRAVVRVPFEFGVPNLHMLLWWARLEPWMAPASLAALAGLAAWTWHHRGSSPWILMGVAGIATRLWAHSTPFDDAFLLFPAVALFRITFHTEHPDRRAATWLFAAVWATLLTPTWAFFSLPAPVTHIINGVETLLWASVLVFLVRVASRERLMGRMDPEGGRTPKHSRGEPGGALELPPRQQAREHG